LRLTPIKERNTTYQIIKAGNLLVYAVLIGSVKKKLHAAFGNQGLQNYENVEDVAFR
jgi:hypothetical protein